MLERLSLYDLLAAFLPGALLLCAIVILFPGVQLPTRGLALPSEFAVAALFAAAILVGEVIQAVGSLLEPKLFKMFGGRPSDLAVVGTLGERYLPADASARIRNKLLTRVGDGASDRHLFLAAMSIAESAEGSKAGAFNAQYGHHRAVTTLLLATLLIMLPSLHWGAAARWSGTGVGVALASCAGLLCLFAWRTWQRGAYYAREVMLAAERRLNADEGAGTSKPKGANAS
jgi:hypothetical protein